MVSGGGRRFLRSILTIFGLDLSDSMILGAARFRAAAKPKCNCYTGMGMAALARKHMVEPKALSRAALLALSCSTRADACRSSAD